ncbi:hypothetical protein DOO78_01770 [Roseicella frigidaeris]|uniref:Uncharacterized protein n=1 Tax=Roseicella frigidaeris TaxID=2230885 RepID=A0A327MF31_9PROT|nr:hypothetical protein DOO78_01770 [Roseicella frigidaeris]
MQNVGGGGGAGGSYVIDGAQHVTFAAYPYAVNGSIVFELEPPSAANDPDSVDWAALATHATASLSADGLWLA